MHTVPMNHKAKRKLKRKQHLLLQKEPHLSRYFTSDITEHLYVANGGLLHGISRELLSSLCEGLAKTIVMPEGKDYCFVTCNDSQASMYLTEKLNGIGLQEECERRGIKHMLSPAVATGLPLRLYVGHVVSIPKSATHEYTSAVPLPPGLILISDYITEEEEQTLLDFFRFKDNNPCVKTCLRGTQHTSSCEPESAVRDVCSEHSDSKCPAEEPEASYVPPEATLKLRRVKHYGYEFVYGSNTVDANRPLPGGIPTVCALLLERIVGDGLIASVPDQLTVNEYLPGAGIPPHIDTHSAFEDGILSVSLGSHTVMDFTDPNRHKVSVFIPQRSLLLMKGESRYLWSHGIAARQFDSVHPYMAGFHATCNEGYVGNTVLQREVRISLTFRTVRTKPCDCGHVLQCT